MKGSRKENGLFLEEFTLLTGCHRKAAIRLLNREARSVSGQGWGKAADLRTGDGSGHGRNVRGQQIAYAASGSSSSCRDGGESI